VLDTGMGRYPDDADLVTQAEMVKAKNNKTKVFVYRQGQGFDIHFGRQAHDTLNDPRCVDAHKPLGWFTALTTTRGVLKQTKHSVGLSSQP